MYLSHRQSASRVQYLPVTFENKYDVSSIAIEKSGWKTPPNSGYVRFLNDEYKK